MGGKDGEDEDDGDDNNKDKDDDDNKVFLKLAKSNALECKRMMQGILWSIVLNLNLHEWVWVVGNLKKKPIQPSFGLKHGRYVISISLKERFIHG